MLVGRFFLVNEFLSFDKTQQCFDHRFLDQASLNPFSHLLWIATQGNGLLQPLYGLPTMHEPGCGGCRKVKIRRPTNPLVSVGPEQQMVEWNVG